MNYLQIIVLLMAIAIVLVGLALKFRITYPLALIIGGTLLGFVPGMEVQFDPNLMLVVILPPILYYAAFSIPFKEFKKNLQVILGLALGLVVVSTLVIGLLFKWLFPDLPWALAFAFGAIISPPDAVAANTILKRFSISSRLLTVLEGESLINDASGLVLYKLAVVALLSGSFSFAEASLEFVKVVIGGVGIGLVSGYLLHWFSSRFFDPILAVVFSFIVPYMTYIIADAYEVSGVLAVVISGLIGARMLRTHFSSLTRVIGWASWDILIILLNCFVFILIGLQLYGILHRLQIENVMLYLGYGVFLTLVVFLVRLLWVYTREFLAHIGGSDHKAKNHSHLSMKETLIVSWAGIRGIVSLTMALALPLSLHGRDIVLFLTFIVIFLTLLIPGLTLGPLVSWLNIQSTNKLEDTEKVRAALLDAAQEEIERLYKLKKIDDEEMSFLLNYFQARQHIFELALKSQQGSNKLEFARQQVLRRKHERLQKMWKNNEIGDHLYNLLQRELDIEEAHLVRAEI